MSTTFGLLSVIGGDTASDFSLFPEGEKPSKSEYQLTNWDEVAQRLRSSIGSMQSISQERGMRISLAGA